MTLDTRKRVRIVTGHPGYPEYSPVVLVDGEPIRAVTRIELDYRHEDGVPLVKLTILGIDVDMDLGAIPEYLVKVVGPKPDRKDRGEVVPK